jgi:hypothetical protein
MSRDERHEALPNGTYVLVVFDAQIAGSGALPPPEMAVILCANPRRADDAWAEVGVDYLPSRGAAIDTGMLADAEKPPCGGVHIDTWLFADTHRRSQ